MKRRNVVSILGMMLFALGLACAQDQDNAPSSDSQPAQPPVPAYGQDSVPSTPISENPPLTGFDLPSLQEHAAPISYLKPGATFSGTATNNIGNSLGNNDFGSIIRGLGTLTLRRLWSHYDLGLDYVGGAGYYNQGNIGWRLMQDLGVEQKIEWKRGQLSLRDNFSYLPEGDFAAADGSLGSVGIAGIGSTPGGLWGGSNLGALGLAPRILNLSLAELSENLSPKSAFTAAGGYAFTHFYGNEASSGAAFIGSSQITAQAGYNRTLTARTQVAAVYSYQGFDFTVAGTAFHSHVVQGMYGHRISGRMDLLLGAGPEITFINSPTLACSNPSITDPLSCLAAGDQVTGATAKSTRLGVAAQARLGYQFTKSRLDLTYERFVTTGGGLFAGAESDVVRLGLDRPLSRVWSLSVDGGVGRHARLQSLTLQQLNACNGAQASQNACPANDATNYMEGYAGAAVHRYFGRSFHGFASFQFNEMSFDHSFCAAGTPCNRVSNRQMVTIGLDWTPRPIRID